MHIIRTAEAMTAVCREPIDSELISLLGAYAAALEEFGDDLDATIIVVEPGDTLAEIEGANGERLVAGEGFAFDIELITRHDLWFDVVRIIADDGAGLVLLVPIDANTDAELMTACERALAEQPA